jgi:hypothetical protein
LFMSDVGGAGRDCLESVTVRTRFQATVPEFYFTSQGVMP